MKHKFINILLYLFISTYACAHPHTFIEVQPTLEINKNLIENINIRWVLDEMTSMMLIMELDENSNGKFEKNENEYIYENYFLPLDMYDYYMQLSNANKMITFKPKNFVASIENNKLIYSFDIVQKIDLKDLKIVFFDKELFVGMVLDEKSITFKGIQIQMTEKLKKQIFGKTQ